MLEVRDLTVRYGDLEAVHGADLSVAAGDFIALLGRNGAGKTSVVRAIAGLIPAAAGTIELDGEPIHGAGAAEVVRRGIAVVPEGREMFGELTVVDNLRLGAYSATGRGRSADRGRSVGRKPSAGWRPAGAFGRLRRSSPLVEERLAGVLEVLPELRTCLDRAAGRLSGGQQQMVAVGRALMASPRLLIVDELSLGLAPKVVATLVEHLRALNETGISILLIEQNINIALSCARYALVFEGGYVRYSGVADDLRHDPDVLRAYLEVEVADESEPAAPGEAGRVEAGPAEAESIDVGPVDVGPVESERRAT